MSFSNIAPVFVIAATMFASGCSDPDFTCNNGAENRSADVYSDPFDSSRTVELVTKTNVRATEYSRSDGNVGAFKDAALAFCKDGIEPTLESNLYTQTLANRNYN